MTYKLALYDIEESRIILIQENIDSVTIQDYNNGVRDYTIIYNGGVKVEIEGSYSDFAIFESNAILIQEGDCIVPFLGDAIEDLNNIVFYKDDTKVSSDVKKIEELEKALLELSNIIIGGIN